MPPTIPTSSISKRLTPWRAYFTKKTPVPAGVDESKSEIKVIDKSNVPASGFVYSFDKDLATYADRWSTLYQY